MLNAKKKRQKARDQAREDRKEKWCDRERTGGGYHGYFSGRRCPRCVQEGTAPR